MVVLSSYIKFSHALGKKLFDSLDNVVSRNAVHFHQDTPRTTARDACHGKTAHMHVDLLLAQDTSHSFTKST